MRERAAKLCLPATHPRSPIMSDESMQHKAPDRSGEYILTLACADRRGIAASVAGSITERGANIIESSQSPNKQRKIRNDAFGK